MATAHHADQAPEPMDYDRAFIGTDSNGFDHHRVRDGSVLVVNQEGMPVERVDGANINDWIDTITERDGWEQRELFSTFGDAILWRLGGGD